MFKVHPNQAFARLALSMSLALVSNAAILGTALRAQAPAAASPARQSGTVKAIDSASIMVVTAAGAQVSVPVAPDATVLQLAPGQTKLSDGQPAKLADIVVGDKVIVGKPGDTDTASRVIVMKSSDIAARNAAEQADWQKRGTSGLIKSVDGTAFTVTAGSKTVKVETTPKTIFRRYAADSVKFQDSTAGTLAQIHPGDQLSVTLDGTPLPSAGNALSFQADAPERGTHTLSATVRDAEGKVVCNSPGLSFSVQRPSLLSPQSPAKGH